MSLGFEEAGVRAGGRGRHVCRPGRQCDVWTGSRRRFTCIQRCDTL